MDGVAPPPVGMHDAPPAVNCDDAPPADHTPTPATPEDTPGAAGSTGPMHAVGSTLPMQAVKTEPVEAGMSKAEARAAQQKMMVYLKRDINRGDEQAISAKQQW
eukprot:4391351-Amphidinium_carterae.1